MEQAPGILSNSFRPCYCNLGILKPSGHINKSNISPFKEMETRNVYTEEVIADTPEKAETAINNRLGTTISVQKVLTSVPSTLFTNVLK